MATLIEKIRRRARSKLETTGNALITRFYWQLGNANGGESRPVFYDIATTVPALLELDKNYETIRAEVANLLNTQTSLPSYHELDPRQTLISDVGQKRWKVFVLYVMGVKPEANRALCPKTSALLDKIPNLLEAFFSILEAGKSVPAHGASYPGYIRYHLGLLVPKDNPPRIRIKDQFYTWKEGHSVLFDDSWDHEVYNQSSGDRVVLLVDTLRRALPWRLRLLNRFYAKGVLRFVYATGVMKNMEKFI